MNAIINYLKESFSKWKKEIKEHRNLILISILFLVIATIADYLSGVYTNRIPCSAVPDLILDNIPSINLSFLFIYYYAFLMILLIVYPLFFRIKELHEVISHFSLLVLIRSIFVCFTHLRVPAQAIAVKFPGILRYLSFENDLFFSGHVALPFLGFLLFKDTKLRYFFLFSTILMGITVLFMHVHYSIDVLAAFFITYGTYKIGNFIFSKIKK